MKPMLLAASMLAAPILAGQSAVFAQPIEGIYVGAGGGANFLSDERVRTVTLGKTTSSVPGGTSLRFGTGYVALGSVGWGFGNGVRVEAEGSYRHNDLDGGAAPGGRVSGSEAKYGAMANVLFDLDIGSPYAFPYFGGGAGYQWAHQKNSTGFASPAASATNISGTQGSFAYQGIAGFAFPIPGVVGLSATAEYRYLGMAGDRKYAGTATGAATAPVTAGYKVTENNNHSLMVGVRYAFNVTPPPTVAPAAAAPAPTAARSFLVFFDWDKSDLSDRGRQIIAEAAQSSTKVEVTRIEVSGHADKSGSPAYNLGLSRRRADTVAAELVRDGVPRASISVMAFGDSRPLVPTAAGVREPQNRRVEIVLK